MTAKQIISSILFVFLAVTTGCFGGTQVKPDPQPYSPSFKYQVSNTNQKVDVSIGIVAPQFSGDGVEWWREQKQDPDVRNMIRSIRLSFNEMLIAKGFTTSGPFESLADMTFPEKKNADLILYPTFDLYLTHDIKSVGRVERGNMLAGSNVVEKCNVIISTQGKIQIVVIEPLSEQKMWMKSIEVNTPKKTFEAYANVCTRQGVTQEIKNSYLQSLEGIYTELMTGADRYVSAEEFQMLKAQAQELREKKAY